MRRIEPDARENTVKMSVNKAKVGGKVRMQRDDMVKWGRPSGSTDKWQQEKV